MLLAILRRNWGRKPTPSPGGKVVSWPPFKGRRRAASPPWVPGHPPPLPDCRQLPFPTQTSGGGAGPGPRARCCACPSSSRSHCPGAPFRRAGRWSWKLEPTQQNADAEVSLTPDSGPTSQLLPPQQDSSPARAQPRAGLPSFDKCVESTRLCNFGDSRPSVPLYNFTTHP